MTRSITPEITVTETGGNVLMVYVPTVTQSQTPTVTNIIASTNVTLEHQP